MKLRMSNRTGGAARAYAAALAIALAALAASCSSVFTASIQGRLIDAEAYERGETRGIANARVFIYTDEADWQADFSAYAEGDEATAPDGRGTVRFFQATETGEDGSYQFSGFIWKTLFPGYGKTADRREIYLLAYHPDYGLWKNPTPIMVVSDVTARIPPMRMEDLWNEGRITGRALDWKDGVGREGHPIRVYVAEDWNYAAGEPTNLRYPAVPTVNLTSGSDGYWTASFRYKKMPGRSDAVNKTKVIVAWGDGDWRAEDPADPAALNAGLAKGDRDLDRDGFSVSQGDATDWYLESAAVGAFDADDPGTIVDTGSITLQRWRFSVNVQGRVVDDANPTLGLDGITVILTAPSSPSGRVYRADTTQNPQNTEQSGFFNLGTVRWTIDDTGDVEADQKAGRIAVSMQLEGATLVSGGATELLPAQVRTLNIRATP